MRGNKGKIGVTLLLASTMALSLWGCASNGNEGSDNGTANAGTNKNAGAASNNGTGNETANGNEASAADPVELTFSFWGSNFEKQAIEKMIKSFNESHPKIHVTPMHVPGDYETKINTLMAAGKTPDVGYLDTPLALKWGKDGKVLNFTPYLTEFPELEDRIETSKLYSDDKTYIGTTIAVDAYNLVYNKDLFKEAGVDLPPSKAENAWTWDEFLKIAQQLTKDKNGKHPNEAGFDDKNIVQYGFDFDGGFGGWYPYLASNGADITNADGTQYTLDSPESVEVFQNLQDLIYKYHVAPSPTAKANFPNLVTQLQTKKVALVHAGDWVLLDLASSKLNYGIAVLPKYKEPKTLFFGSGAVVFADTKRPKEALEFYAYYNDPAQVDLYKVGLWMPIQKKYYTDPELVKSWIDNEYHTPEFKEAAVDYLINNGVPSPNLSLKNFLAIQNVINPAIDQIWTNKKPAKDVLEELKAKVQPLLQGKYATTIQK